MRQIQISEHSLLFCLGNRGSGRESGLPVQRLFLSPVLSAALRGGREGCGLPHVGANARWYQLWGPC